jgi:hypothetical protein
MIVNVKFDAHHSIGVDVPRGDVDRVRDGQGAFVVRTAQYEPAFGQGGRVYVQYAYRHGKRRAQSRDFRMAALYENNNIGRDAAKRTAKLLVKAFADLGLASKMTTPFKR